MGMDVAQTWKYDKKQFSTQFWPVWPKFGPLNFYGGFLWSNIVPSYHPMQFNEKLVNQAWENNKKTNFGSDFDPNLVPPKDFQGFYHW